MDPSLTQAPTDKPTMPPQSNSGSFMLRLYWQSSYYWQETHSETWWCLECTKCDEFSLGDGPKHGCSVPGDNGSSCREGHTIWIRKCKDTRRNFKWQILKNSGSGDQIRASGSNLCLSTRSNKYIEMKQCNSNSQNQLFKSISNLNRFELRPYYQRNWSMNDAKCLSQLHHPKASSGLVNQLAWYHIQLTNSFPPVGQGVGWVTPVSNNEGSRDSLLGGLLSLSRHVLLKGIKIISNNLFSL